ncbi:MAG: TRAP transporter large permease [Clostridiales Family XIII bacterium]|jgi:tripartite ATP-independent transporter DctM subunit|nr:TRAP transporter large permease [Clostridiales Family XIII bacterium]
MDGNITAVIGIVVMLALIFLGVNIGLSMFIIGFVGYAYVLNPNAALSVLGTYSTSSSMTYTMTVIPLFVLMGNFAFYSGISNGLFTTSRVLMGRARGSLAYAGIVACALFGSICGSLAATTATMSRVAKPVMAEHGYKPEIIGGVLACSGTLGTLIPPSTPFIIFGIMTETSIGKLFAAGIFPGIVMAACFCVCVFILGKADSNAFPSGQRYSVKEKIFSLKGYLGMFILFLLVLGGIFTGATSVTEAAAIGAAVSLIILIAKRMFTKGNVRESLFDTIKTLGMVMITLVGANMFGTFLTVTNLPTNLAKWINSLDVPSVFVIIIIIVVYAVLGCVMDTLALMILSTPIFVPIIVALGYDVVWFGVIIVMIMNMGAVTPPVGLSCYVASGVMKIPLGTVFRGVVPFLIAFVASLVIVIAFPQTALFLPSIVRGG